MLKTPLRSIFSAASLLALSLAGACQPANLQPAAPSLDASSGSRFAPTAPAPLQIKVGQGKGSMLLQLKAADAEGFTVQANSNGNSHKLASQVSHLRVFLFDVDSGVRPTAGTAAAPLDLETTAGVTRVTDATIAFTGSTQTVLLTNVPSNANAAGRFFIGVRALESSTNITNAATGFSYGTAPGSQLALSDAGGDTAMPGGVAIGAGYLVSNSAALAVTLPLLNATGATLDAQVTVTNGSPTLPGINIQ